MQSQKATYASRALVFVAITAISACGGGGGGSTGGGGGGVGLPTTGATLTGSATQNQTATKQSVNMTLLNGQTAKAYGSMAVVQSSGTQASSPLSLWNVAQTAVSQINAPRPAGLTAATSVTTANCTVSGTMTLSATTDATGALTALAVTYNSCSVTSGSAMNGTLNLSGITYNTTVVPAAVTGFAMSASLTNTVASTGTTSTLNASLSFGVSGTAPALTYSVTGSNLSWSTAVNGTTTYQGALTTFNFTHSLAATTSTTGITTVTSTSDTASYTLADSTMAGIITVNTKAPIVKLTGALYPSSGIIDVTSTATGSGALEITINGNETYAPSTNQVSWNYYSSGIIGSGTPTAGSSAWATL